MHQRLAFAVATRFDGPPELGLPRDPAGDGRHLAQQLGFLVRFEAEPRAQPVEFGVEHGVGQGLKAGHGSPPIE